MGLFWHLRDPSGKLAVVEAGRLTFDFNPFDFTITPNLSDDADAVECAALGGDKA